MKRSSEKQLNTLASLHPAAVWCDMVLHQASRARRVGNTGIGSEVRHGATSGVSCETSKTELLDDARERLAKARSEVFA